MFDEPEFLTPAYLRELEVWVCAWYNKVIAAIFLRHPYHLDEKTVESLQRYYHARYSPTEAAEVGFESRH